MKKGYIFFLLIAIIYINIIPNLSLAQGQGEVTEGRDYWFGIPYVKMKTPEGIRGEFPIVLWISSKVNTKATISDMYSGSLLTVDVYANKTTQVPMNDIIMNTESEVVENKGIHITSKDPISVCVYQSYKWSGEAFRVIPVEWLGKEYVSCNLYIDETDEIKPAQILIVATEDNTIVSVTPTKPLAIHGTTPFTISLNKGQTYLMLSKEQKAYVQDWASDITGTYIKANKPIGVISGHTKGTFPRFFVGMRSGWMEPYANFARNMLCEMLWPIELLGTEYISAPIKYSNRVINQNTVIQDTRGDLIRFVAAYDNTVIYQMKQDGTGFMKIGPTMKRGDWYNIIEQENAAMYRTTKPCLVAQFGKTWWADDGMMGPITSGKSDQPLNPHTSGQGMMLILAPIDRWCSYANFRAPDAIDDFVYITFVADDIDKIRFDGQKITALWGSSIKEIKGTKYAYVANNIAPGDHYIEAIDGAKFAAYAYGNWDRVKDGFAYGYPIGINYASHCDDSLYVIDTMICGNVEAQGFDIDLQQDTSCAAIFNAIFRSSESYNYDFQLDKNFQSGDKTIKYTLKVINPLDSAFAIVDVMTRSGKTVRRVYQYYPDQIEVDPTLVDFGNLMIDQEVCKNFTITNVGKSKVNILKLKLKSKKAEFTIKTTDFPAILNPGESKVVTVCAKPKEVSKYAVVDSVIAELSCFEETIVALMFTTGEPDVWISDANWGQVPVGQERSRTVDIINQGSKTAEIYTIDWPDKLHFTRVENLPLPLSIEPGNKHTFTVYYKPDVPGVVHSTRATFTSNATKTKLYSDWTGEGILAGPLIEGYDWLKKRVIDEFVPEPEKTEGYKGWIIIDNSGNTKLDVVDVVIENDVDGVFRINKLQIPAQLNPSNPVTIDAYFYPKAEKTYISTVKLITMFNGEEKVATAELKGIGILPHINVEGYDYSPAILVGSSKDGAGLVEQVTKDPTYAMQLTIFNLKIDGVDKDAFTIDPTWLANNPYPIIIPINQSINVPIKFTAKHPGGHFAQLIAESDAPKTDDHVGDLIGKGLTEGLNSSDYDYQTIFKFTTKDGKVYLTNYGSSTVTVTKDIAQSLSGDVNFFEINTWYVSNNGIIKLNRPMVPFQLEENDTLWVDAKFKPTEVKRYDLYVNYETSLSPMVSHLWGYGMELLTLAEIPKNYVTKPGIPIYYIEFKYGIDQGETKPLESGNIRKFTAKVRFKSEGTLNVQDVYPRVAGPQDILTAGTMTEGWIVDEAKIDGMDLVVTMHNDNQGLRGGGTLFKFIMDAFLSDLDVIPLPCEFTPDNRPYIEVRKIPGEIKIAPVCVNTLRLIKLTDNEYFLGKANPNPVEGTTKIEYGVGLEALTTITLYNINGDKVATLINQSHKPGYYEITLNLNDLNIPSGVYYYRMESGPFSKVQQLIINR